MTAYISKPLLVGETNPYGKDARLALYPAPRRSAGGRLCFDIMGFESTRNYLAKFDRINLCTGEWTLAEAREMAEKIRAAHRGPLVLFGRRVAQAFRVPETFFTVQKSFLGPVWDVILLPHPSGRCRVWNDPLAIAKAREILKEYL